MTRAPILVLTLTLAVGTLSSSAAAQTCVSPALLFSVDHSSSMIDTLPDGQTKWEAAVTAVQSAVAALDASVHVGLQVFPHPNLCEPGAIVLDLGTHTPEEVVAALGGPPPLGGHYTPMAQTLAVAADYAPLVASGREAHLVLVTDGWQWCDPYDVSTRFTPITEVERLAALGVSVHIVGFGMGVDALTLNRAAVAAGTAIAGCDPTGSEPTSPNPCYQRAEDGLGLLHVLETIAWEVGVELCNGIDDDCDGEIDEGLDQDGDGALICGGVDPSSGVWILGLADCDDSNAAVHPGAAELCNGIDDDCDGTVDPGCACTDGEERSCGTDVGVCSFGLQRCAAGLWGDCEGQTLPSPLERCDGLDDDCDGEIDENASCEPGASCLDGRCQIPESLVPDAGAGPRGETVLAPTDGACGCRILAPSEAPGGLGGLALLGLGLTLGLRRRQRRRG